jgi:hypothetical protein
VTDNATCAPIGICKRSCCALPFRPRPPSFETATTRSARELQRRINSHRHGGGTDRLREVEHANESSTRVSGSNGRKFAATFGTIGTMPGEQRACDRR